MATVEFTRDYDHTWPSRAVTAFKAGWSGTVKAEVEEAARKAGALKGSRKSDATPPPPPELPDPADPDAIVRDNQ